MRKISIKAIVIGGIVDILTTNVFTIPLVVYVASTLDMSHMTKLQFQTSLTHALHTNPVYLTLQVAIGVGCSVFAGYLAARLARHDELLNGALSAWLCVTLGIYSLLAGSGSASIIVRIGEILAAPVAGYAGGYLRRRQLQVDAGAG